MELKHSSSGIPYIEFDDKGDDFEVKKKVRLAFIKLTNSDKAFKYVSVKGYRSTISAKRKINIIERENFIADVYLNGFPKGFTGDDCHNFTKHKYTFLRKVLKNYIPEDKDYIPVNAIERIAEDIKGYNEPKRRLKKKRRKRRGVVKLSDEALAEKRAKKEEVKKKAEEKEKKEKEKKLNKREKEIKKLEKEFNGKKRRKKTKPKQLKKKNSTEKVEMSKTCRTCGKKLFEVPSCGTQMIIGHNKRWMPIVHKGKEPCKACGVMPGGRHHLHCPYEECPRCHKMLRYCGCFK